MTDTTTPKRSSWQAISTITFAQKAAENLASELKNRRENMNSDDLLWTVHKSRIAIQKAIDNLSRLEQHLASVLEGMKI